MNFFEISKLGWFLAEPDSLMTAALAVAFILMFTRFSRIAKGIFMTVALGWLSVTVLPVANAVMLPLENKYPVLYGETLPPYVDGIIVLGGAVSPKLSAVRSQMQIPMSAGRITAMEDLAAHYPDAVIVYTGGSGNPSLQQYKEADAVKARLEEYNPSLVKRMIFENRSRNTYENAVFSKEMAKPQPGQVWLLVTSSYHMPRAKAVFDKAGWPTIPYPTDFKTDGTLWGDFEIETSGNMSLFKIAWHEYLGLLAYKFSGKI